MPNTNVSVLEWLNRQAPFSAHVAAFGMWDVISAILNRERCGFYVNGGYELRRRTEEYTSELSKTPAGKADVIGVVIAINGELHDADTYALPKLSKKLWPELLEAGATAPGRVGLAA